MAAPAPAPRRQRGWLKALVWIFGVFVILLVATYFVGTSSAFFKGVILPRVSKSLNADVTVSEAPISLFKEAVLHNLKVQPHNAEPLLTAPEVRARYRLLDILGGNIHLDEVALSSPTVVLVENADGSKNLDPVLQSQKQEKKKPERPAKSSKPAQIDLKKVTLTNATVRRVKNSKDGARETTELSHVNVTLDDVKNGQTGKLLLNAELSMQDTAPPPGTNGLLQAKVSGNFVFSLTADLKPASITGNTRVEITQATGAMSELAALGSELDCQMTPSEIKQLALRFQRGNTRLGEVRASGPFDAAKTEGRLKVEIVSIDKQVLNLAGAKSGIDFGSTTLNSTNDVQFSKSGKAITASGQLNLAKLQVTQKNQTTPSLDLLASYDITVDSDAKNALLRSLILNGTQKGNPLLHAELTSPMNLAWGNVTNAVGDSTVGDIAPAGNANLRMKLLSQQGGKQLTFDLDSQVANLTAGTGSNQITQANVTLAARGQATDLKLFNLAEYHGQVARQGQPMLDLSGSGTYDASNRIADLQVNLRATLARLLEAMPQSNVVVSSGTAELKGHVTQKQDMQTVTGNLVLADLTGRFGSNEFRSFGATMDLHINKTPRETQFPKIIGNLTEGGKPGGSFAISGNYETNGAAEVNLKLTDFNQNGLRPVLEPLLTDKKLVSVAINGTAITQLNPQGDSALKADLTVTNLVVSDPKNQFPATPLEARMQIDTSVRKQVAEVRQCQLTFTPTQRGKNELRLAGKIDMSRTNAYQGNLKLTSESLDVTSYYDLFAREKPEEKKTGKTAAAARGTTAAPAPAPAPAEVEPAAKQLPFRNFAADVSIGRFYLREVEITNLQTTAKIDGGHVLLNPFTLALNGAPVNANADLDLGIPGYKYDVSFNTKSVPLAPLVNSFDPEQKGRLGGTFTAQAKASGTGITGASLQKSLSGQFDLNSTNLNLSVVNVKARWLKALINVVAAVPELLRNPESAIGTLAKSVTGLGAGGLMDELKRSPIDAISAHGAIGSGRVDLQAASVQSPAFRADAKGTITLAPVLTNSTLAVPVSISLAQAVAERVGLAAAGTAGGYAKIPDFYTMKGTISDPKNDYNKPVLLGIAA
ncbi:MAG: hypothetical protein DME26_12050, partial [Verrucomicrobia bacterium]